MKIKKAIEVLYNRVSDKTELEAQEEIMIIMKSFELQIKYGCDSKITAFSNSIYTPTLKQNELKETALKEQKKKLTHTKHRTALRHENIISQMRINGSSYQQIASYLNQYIVHRRNYFNRKYIERFCKDKNIT
ncbi:MAG: hypothetical protein ACI81I_000292 [Arcobacteraceae bacterium]|jgi:hypothetical protein